MGNMFIVFPLGVLGIAALVVRRIFGTWLAPAAFFLLAWFVFTIIPILAAPEYEINVLGLWIIVAIALSFSMGSLILPTNPGLLESKVRSDLSDNILTVKTTLFWTTVVLSSLSLTGTVLLFFYGLGRFNMDLSFWGLAALPNQFSIDRYDQTMVLPTHIKLLIYLLYPASLMAGIGVVLNRKKAGKLVFLTPILVAVMYGVLIAVRSSILMVIVMWLSGYCGTRVVMHDQLTNLFKPRKIVLITVSIFSFGLLFFFTQWLRQGLGTDFMFTILVDKVKSAFFGYLSLFTNWASHYRNSTASLGVNTVAGPFELLGLTERKMGFYTEIVEFGYGWTNVYTALRGLIQDFTLPGTIVFGILSGLVAHLAFIRCLRGAFLWIIPLTMFYAFTMYSPLISIFNYNSVLSAWVFTMVILLLIPRRLRINP